MAACHGTQVKSSGHVVTIEKDFEGFKEVEVSNAFEVSIAFSEQDESVTVHVDDNLVPYLDMALRGDKLMIGLEDNLSIQGNAVMEVEIVTSDLQALQGSGASKIHLLNELKTSSFSLDLSGACNFDGGIKVEALDIELSGASNVSITGVAKNVTIESSGASTVKGSRLFADQLIADLSGACTVDLDVSQEISMSGSGASTLNYSGNARVVNQDVSGVSSINRR